MRINLKSLALLALSISAWVLYPAAAPAKTALGPGAAHANLLADTPLAVSEYIQDLAPEKNQVQTCKQIVGLLSQRHYRRQAVDDLLSERLLQRYLSDLDANRVYFLDDEIQSFETFRHRLDDALRKGDVTPAFTIYAAYQRNLVERLIFYVNRLERDWADIDLTVDESMQADRETAPWPRHVQERRDLWRKLLKNEVLKLKLAEKTDAEIVKTLSKRYRSQLNRVSQTHSEDVFRVYMNALASSFDPHTQYFSPRMSENFKIQMSLSLEGIGAVLQTEDEHTKVVRLVPAGPADKSKELKPGDRIVGVGQGAEAEIVDVVGWRLDDVVQLIRGPKDTVVSLEVLPGTTTKEGFETRRVRITRNTVKLEEQAARKKTLLITHDGRPFKIGVIQVPTFYLDFKAFHDGQNDYKSTTRDVRRLLTELVQEGVDGVVVDLRDNGGGALQEASELTGLFIKEGPTVQVHNADGRLSTLKDTDAAIAYDGPLVVMVNRLSASAAEIFAGAVQDYQRGVVTGHQTFGKGTVQSLLDLDNGQLKLTFAKFYRVSGQSTQNTGVIPDVAFPPIYDADEIGESALPDALPWSRIRPVDFQAYTDLTPLLPQIRGRHEQRRALSPDFVYLTDIFAEIKKARTQTLIPLGEPTRKRQVDEQKRRRLYLENTLRAAKGQPLLETLDDLDAEADESESESESELEDRWTAAEADDDEPDPLLLESGRILADLIVLSNTP